MKIRRNAIAIALSVLLTGTAIAQIVDLDEPVDKILDQDYKRQLAAEKIEAELFAREINIISLIDPIDLKTEIKPGFIATKEIEPDFQQLLTYEEIQFYEMTGKNLESSEMVDGTGPVKGSNYIKIYIDNDSSAAGSEADYIYMRFGEGHYLKLLGYYGAFPKGYTLTWDLNDHISSIPQDRWDQIALQTVSSDGIKIDRLIVVHSGQEILDWTVNTWLDKWNGTYMGLGAKIMDRKQEWVIDSDNASVFYGAQEIGKTDGDKYGTGGAWCSEFASWCLRKSGVITPTGSIGTGDMKSWFHDKGRDYYRSEVKNKTYVMVQGDYISLFDGTHSAVFMYWIDSTDTITDSTRFKTIEGNCGGTVKTATRTVGDIDRVGRTK